MLLLQSDSKQPRRLHSSGASSKQMTPATSQNAARARSGPHHLVQQGTGASLSSSHLASTSRGLTHQRVASVPSLSNVSRSSSSSSHLETSRWPSACASVSCVSALTRASSRRAWQSDSMTAEPWSILQQQLVQHSATELRGCEAHR